MARELPRDLPSSSVCGGMPPRNQAGRSCAGSHYLSSRVGSQSARLSLSVAHDECEVSKCLQQPHPLAPPTAKVSQSLLETSLEAPTQQQDLGARCDRGVTEVSSWTPSPAQAPATHTDLRRASSAPSLAQPRAQCSREMGDRRPWWSRRDAILKTACASDAHVGGAAQSRLARLL